ncbi:unnamed protein product [Lampetra planeri]
MRSFHDRLGVFGGDDRPLRLRRSKCAALDVREGLGPESERRRRAARSVAASRAAAAARGGRPPSGGRLIAADDDDDGDEVPSVIAADVGMCGARAGASSLRDWRRRIDAWQRRATRVPAAERRKLGRGATRTEQAVRVMAEQAERPPSPINFSRRRFPWRAGPVPPADRN